MEVQLGPDIEKKLNDLAAQSGRVKPIDGEEAFSRLKARTEAQRHRAE